MIPQKFVSRNGQSHEVKPGGSIFLSGKNPDKDIYEIVYPLTETTLSGLRLDALHHESFTNGGLARSDSGNFVLTDISLVISAPDGTEVTPEIASAQAEFEQGSLTIEKAYDGNSNTGWAVLNPGNMKIDRSAMFLLDAPIAVAESSTLTVTLKFESPHKFHQMNWFRLSATSDTKPTLDGKNEIPAEVLAALKLEPQNRSAELKAALNKFYTETASEVVQLDQQIEKTKTALTNHIKGYLETMVMRELPKPRETYRLQRGAWDNPDKSLELTAGVPAVLPALPENGSSQPPHAGALVGRP